MAAKRNRTVITLESKLGEKADIKFDSDKKVFYCSAKIIGARIESTDFSKVQYEVQSRLDNMRQELVWKSVIELQVWHNHRGLAYIEHGGEVGFTAIRVLRYWIAPRNTDTLRCEVWEDRIEQKFRADDPDKHGFPRYETRMVSFNREDHAQPFLCEADWNNLPFCDKGHIPLDRSAHQILSRHSTWFDYDEALWTALINCTEAVNGAFDYFKKAVEEGPDTLRDFKLFQYFMPTA